IQLAMVKKLMAGKPEKPEKREGKSSHAALRVAIGGVFSLLAGLAAQVIPHIFLAPVQIWTLFLQR
ncbi:MAG: hypothetical protein K8R40_02160, partial [Anaerolineaceae bacterium]|nr:hypothetical protein [Anaerolineaceae bacterium]